MTMPIRNLSQLLKMLVKAAETPIAEASVERVLTPERLAEFQAGLANMRLLRRRGEHLANQVAERPIFRRGEEPLQVLDPNKWEPAPMTQLKRAEERDFRTRGQKNLAMWNLRRELAKVPLEKKAPPVEEPTLVKFRGNWPQLLKNPAMPRKKRAPIEGGLRSKNYVPAAGAATVGALAALEPEEAEAWPRREIADMLRTLAKKGKEFEFLESLGFPKEMSRHIAPTADTLSAMEDSHASKAYELLKDFAEGSQRKLSVRAGGWADPSVHAVGAKIAPVYVEQTGAVQSRLALGPASHEVGHGLSADKAVKLKMASALPREEQNRLVTQLITDNFTAEKSQPVRELGEALLASFNRKKGMLRAEGKAAGYERSGLSEFDSELVANGFEYEKLKAAGGTMSPASIISYARRSKDPAIRAALLKINELDPSYMKAVEGYSDASFGTKVSESLKGKGKKLVKASATLGGPGVLMAAQEGNMEQEKGTTIEELQAMGLGPSTQGGTSVEDLKKMGLGPSEEGTTVEELQRRDLGPVQKPTPIRVPVEPDEQLRRPGESWSTYITRRSKTLHGGKPEDLGKAAWEIMTQGVKQPVLQPSDITAKVPEQPDEATLRQVFAADAETAIPLASAAEAKRKEAWDAYTGGRGAALQNVNVGAPTKVSASEEYKTVSAQDLKDAAEGFRKAFLQTASTKGAVGGKERLLAALETFKALNPIFTPAGNMVVQGVNRLMGRPQDIEEILRMESETLPSTGNYAGSKVVDFVLQQIPGFIPLGGWGSKLAKGAKVLKGAEKVAEGVKVGEGIAKGTEALTVSERLLQIAQEAKAAKLSSTEELASRIKALHDAGYGQKFIADQLGVGRQVVRTHLIRMGLTRTMEEGQELARAWHPTRTEEELRAARLQTFKDADRRRRYLEKGLNKEERKLVRLVQGMMPPGVPREEIEQLTRKIQALPEGERQSALARLLQRKQGSAQKHWDGEEWRTAEEIATRNSRLLKEQPFEAVYPDELAARGGLPRRGRKALLPGAPEIDETAAELSSSGERGSEYLLKLAAENKAVKLSSEEKLRNLLLGKAPEKAETAGQAMDMQAAERFGTKDILGVNVGKVGRVIQHTAFSTSDRLLRSQGAGAVVDPIEQAFNIGRRNAQGTVTEIENVIAEFGIKQGTKESAMVGRIINGDVVRNAPQHVRDAAQRIQPIFDKMAAGIEAIPPDRSLFVSESLFGALKNLSTRWDKVAARLDAILGKGKGKDALLNTMPKHLRESFKKGEINDVVDLGKVYAQARNRILHDLPAYEKAMQTMETMPDGFLKEIAEDFVKGYLGDPNAGGTLMKAGKAVNAYYYKTLLGSNARSAWTNLTQSLNTMVEMGFGPTIKEAGKAVGVFFNPKFYKTGRDFQKLDDLLYQTGEFIDAMPGIEAAEELTKAARTGKRISRFFNEDVLMGAFNRAEFLNRKIAFRTGYEWAISKGLSQEQAIAKGQEVIKTTQFVYGPSSPVRLARWPVLGQFSTYRANQVQFMQKVLQDGFYDFTHGAKTSENVQKMGRMLVLMTAKGGINVATTGSVGAALAGTVSELWQSIGPGAQDAKDFGYWIARAARGNESFKNFAEEVAKRIPGVGGVYRTYNWLFPAEKASKTKRLKPLKGGSQ